MFRSASSTIACVSSRLLCSTFASHCHPCLSVFSRFVTTVVPSATLSSVHLPPIHNEPMLNYAPGSTEAKKLSEALHTMLNAPPVDIPCVVGGKEIRTGKQGKQLFPSNHSKVLATFHEADQRLAQLAIEKALAAKAHWESLSFASRAAIFLRAADLLSTKYRYQMLAATILGQGKNIWQAEIDAAAEQADFWRFNTAYAEQIYRNQPEKHAPMTWNRMEYRSLEGFVLAISPFNFTAIGANLVGSPVLMGNVVLWKPSSTALYANYLTLQILQEAGMPDGVVNFLPGDGIEVGRAAFAHSAFAGLHFTGSTKTFQTLWKNAAQNLSLYQSFPRLVGETGGKNFHFVHASAAVDDVVNHTIRSAFEYSGQKCSACSRAYIPASLWPAVKAKIVEQTKLIIEKHFGQPNDPQTLVSAVIDDRSFARLKGALDKVRQEQTDSKSAEVEIIVGGKCDDRVGYFVEPTIVEVKSDPRHWLMREELFGPVLSVFVYPDAEYEKWLEICDQTAVYALTGAIFSKDRYALEVGFNKLRNTAGNFYVNDKSTGAVVGQQAFGGGRGSGTNDKAGSMWNLLRWVSPRTIKETFVGQPSWKYPHISTQWP